MRNRRAPVVLLGTIALAMPLAACSGDAEPQETVTVTVSATPEPPSTPGPTETITAEPTPLPDTGPDDDAPFVANTAPDTAEVGAGARLSPVDLRFGVHEGYDRLVLDLAGEGTPGWHAEYVADPTQQAVGGPVYLEGEAYLAVLVRGVVYPTETGAQPYEGPQRITPAVGGVIEDVVYGSLFEGQQEIFVGLSSEQPFRVFSLADPTRVVIDVQHG